MLGSIERFGNFYSGTEETDGLGVISTRQVLCWRPRLTPAFNLPWATTGAKLSTTNSEPQISVGWKIRGPKTMSLYFKSNDELK